MELPIKLKLRRKLHRDIAKAQDLVLDEFYKFFPEAVLHGGTAIWRCYNGNRFSEDLDFFIEKDVKKLNSFFSSIEKKGYKVIRKKISENSLFSKISFNGVIVRVEAIFAKKDSIIGEYETSEGLIITVYTFDVETLVLEKINTYLSRKKIRDLYDIFFLLRYSEKTKVKNDLKNLINNFKQPVDEENLITLIISGVVPSSKKMLEYIKKWAK